MSIKIKEKNLTENRETPKYHPCDPFQYLILKKTQ